MTLAPPAVADPPHARAFWLAVLTGLGTIRQAARALPADDPLRDAVLSGLGTIAAAIRRAKIRGDVDGAGVAEA